MVFVLTTTFLCLVLCCGGDAQLTSLKLLLAVIATDEASKVSGHAHLRSLMQIYRSLRRQFLHQRAGSVPVLCPKVPAGIPPAPINPKMAGLLRMLAQCKLVLAFGRRSALRRVRSKSITRGISHCACLANRSTLPRLPAKVPEYNIYGEVRFCYRTW